MLVVDIHESVRLYDAIKQLVPQAEYVSTSQNNWSDFYMQAEDGRTLQREHKSWSEVLGNLDHIEEQLGRCQPNADDNGIIIRGVMTSWDDSHCMTWERAGGWLKPTGRGWDKQTKEPIPYYQSYKGVQTFLARIQDWGFKVHLVETWQDTANLVGSLYHNGDSRTFQRLIKPKPVLTMGVSDDRVRKMALQLMGSIDGIGEEISVAIAGKHQTFAALMEHLQGEGDWHRDFLADIPLRNGKRTVGPAAVERVRKGLGL